MGYLIGIIKKFLGAREFISAMLTALSVAYYIALAVFVVSLINVIFDIYTIMKQLFDMHSSTLAGSGGGNNFNDVIWAVSDAYGITHVFETFLPLVFSTLSIYLTLFLTRMLLDFKAKALASMHRAANLFLG